MKHIKHFISNIEQYIAVLCLTLMLCVLTYNTIARYFFHAALPWAEEICAYCQIWLVYISVSYAVRENAHICIDSVLGLYPKKLKGVIMSIGLLAWLIFGIIMTYAGVEYTISTFVKGGRAISVPLPIWIVYLAIPVGHALLCVRLIQQLIFHIKCIVKGIDPTTVLTGPPAEDVGMFDEEKKDDDEKKGGQE